jgi:hypothetical protein
LSHAASSLKLETAPAAGPWPQAARAWMELGLWGSAVCQRCLALGSCCLPCLKGLTSSHSSTQPPILVPPWQLQLHWEMVSGPGIGRAGNHPLQVSCSSDSEALPFLLHCACPHNTYQGPAAQCGLLWTLQGRPSPGLQSPADRQTRHVRLSGCCRRCTSYQASYNALSRLMIFLASSCQTFTPWAGLAADNRAHAISISGISAVC